MDGIFPRFGPAHLAVLALTPAAALALAAFSRRIPSARTPVRIVLALSLIAVEIGWFLALLLHYRVGWRWLLPLQLSDASILLTVFVILTMNQRVFDIVFYWGLTAVPLAMLMPDILEPFPDPYTIVFFVVHGLVVAILLYLVWSGQMRPGPRSALDSFVVLNAFMLVVLAVNFTLDTNYMYLMRKPDQPSLLDYFGEWPLYILTSEFVAALLFGVLALPFRQRPGRNANNAVPETP